MTRGTILLIGPRKREYDLFLSRLEKEGFSVERKAGFKETVKWLRDAWPQAVLFSAECPPKVATDTIRVMSVRKQKLPFIILGRDEVAPLLRAVKGIAEEFLLHRLAVSHAVRRLILGIKLCQIRREDYI